MYTIIIMGFRTDASFCCLLQCLSLMCSNRGAMLCVAKKPKESKQVQMMVAQNVLIRKWERPWCPACCSRDCKCLHPIDMAFVLLQHTHFPCSEQPEPQPPRNKRRRQEKTPSSLTGLTCPWLDQVSLSVEMIDSVLSLSSFQPLQLVATVCQAVINIKGIWMKLLMLGCVSLLRCGWSCCQQRWHTLSVCGTAAGTQEAWWKRQRCQSSHLETCWRSWGEPILGGSCL